MKVNVAFVLMPFSDDFLEVYSFLIKEALEEADYDVKRADDIKSQNNIIGDIINGIISSDLVIADLTGNNPNVYYELGIAHAFNKNVILLTQSVEELPFDLRSYRVIPYDLHFAKMRQAKSELINLAKEAAKGTALFGNPVKDFGQIDSHLKDDFNNNSAVKADNENFGLLDYKLKIEQGFEELSEIVTEVGEKLGDEVTPEIERSGKALGSNSSSSKEQIRVVKGLANHFQSYSVFIKPKNDRYRTILKDIESGLEYMLSGNSGVKSDSEEEVANYIDVLLSVEQSASEGRQGFVDLIETMESLPRIERTFDRSKAGMVVELKEFIGNIDQTIAVINRSIYLAKALRANL